MKKKNTCKQSVHLGSSISSLIRIQNILAQSSMTHHSSPYIAAIASISSFWKRLMRAKGQKNFDYPKKPESSLLLYKVFAFNITILGEGALKERHQTFSAVGQNVLLPGYQTIAMTDASLAPTSLCLWPLLSQNIYALLYSVWDSQVKG